MSRQDEGVRQFTVAPDDDGIRVDRWFKRHLDATSFTTVAKWARTGQLRLDGACACSRLHFRQDGLPLLLPAPLPGKPAASMTVR